MSPQPSSTIAPPTKRGFVVSALHAPFAKFSMRTDRRAASVSGVRRPLSDGALSGGQTNFTSLNGVCAQTLIGPVEVVDAHSAAWLNAWLLPIAMGELGSWLSPGSILTVGATRRLELDGRPETITSA